MKILELKPRFLREVPEPGLPGREESLEYQQLSWSIPAEQAALVLVDCWNDYLLESFVARAGRICRELILPTVQACRAAGVTIVHAPSEEWTPNYNPWLKYAAEPEPGYAAPQEESAWPPRAFARREGEAADFEVPRTGREPGYLKWCEEVPPSQLRISTCLGPEPGDIMVSDGAELHRLCQDLKILHLFYAGFAANICLQHRCYGMRPMRERGYNTILLRDCTTAIEAPDTVGNLTRTRIAIMEIEMKVGASLTAAELQQACR